MCDTGVTDEKGVGPLEENRNGIDEDLPDFKSAVDNITGPPIVDSDLFMMSHPKWKLVEVSSFYDLRWY